MTDWKALCAELAHEVQQYALDRDDEFPECLDRARAALAQPAPPAAGEVGEGVTDEAAVEAAAELIYAEAMEWAARTPIPHGHCNIPAWQHGGNSDAQDVARRVARAVLARYGHQPAPAAEGEVAELVEWLRNEADYQGIVQTRPSVAEKLTRAADLLEQRHPAPVPVAERLPEAEDCDGEGRCWWSGSQGLHWELCGGFRGATNWLPATALPLPQGEVE